MAPQTRVPVHTVGQKRWFSIPIMVVFETHHARKHGVGSGMAPQTRLPLHIMGPKKCFWIPEMVVFEAHYAKTYSLGSGVALNTHTSAHHGPEKVFFDT